MASAALFYRRLAVLGPHSLPQWLVYVVLLPLGWLYGGLMRVRARLYRRGWLAAYRSAVPVISVGNLSVGGTGKTPVVDHLIRYCLSLNKRVAVVSRGYASGKGEPLRVVCAGQGPLLDVAQAGDEPWLLARRNPEACILVAPRRARGVRHAVEVLGAEVVLLDDGFQHLAVKRDLDIVLFDGRRPFGNGQVLPAGLLREPKSALKRGDIFILTRCGGDLGPALPVAGPVLHCRHVLGDEARDLNGEQIALSQLADKQGVAFAGIAEPDGFFQALRSRGLQLAAELPFGDHCGYGPADLQKLRLAAKGGDYLITTEKDGVKLPAEVLPLPCYQVPMTLEFHEDGALETFLRPILLAKENGS